MMKNIVFISIILFLASSCTKSTKIDLSGTWQFAMDQNDVGEKEAWFAQNLEETFQLPGSMMTNDKGFTPDLKTPWTGSIYDSSFYFNPALEKYRQAGDVKFPFWLTPNKYYRGAAWYRKEITIPTNWMEKRIVLHLERPHWQTKLWINGKLVGEQNSLSTPHEFDISSYVNKGKNNIAIEVDNRSDKVNVGPDSHSISDHTQGNWNGMVGDLYLEATEKVFIDDVQIYPDVDKKLVTVLIQMTNTSNEAMDAEIQLQANLKNSEGHSLQLVSEKIVFKDIVKTLEVSYLMGDDMMLWDEFAPNLYQMKVSLRVNGNVSDEKTTTFGMRKIEVKDGKLYLNHRRVFMRGTLECNTFPKTGFPPTDVDSWKKVFNVMKASGLNHVRFHSHCPPEAAFIAADELGIYLQPEAASWPNHGSALGYCRPIDNYISNETERIIKAYGNHPSFVLWAYCNEPYGRYVEFLDKDLAKWKAKDNRRLYTGACIGRSWTVNSESEFVVRSYPRGLPFKQQPNSTFSYEDRIADESRPYITHEMGQYCVYPDFKEIDKYSGVYKAKNFEMFQDILNENHMGDQAEDFLMASGNLQALCYKAEIEGELRTTTLDGFQLLGLNDFPGQGSAIIGLLNVFWEEKGYITTGDIKKFCGETVPLAKLNKFVFTNKESLTCPVEVSHYGQYDLEATTPVYIISTSKGDTLIVADLATKDIPTGQLSELGEINFPLNKIEAATKCKLELTVGTHSNSWDFWVYPAKLSAITKDEVFYTKTLDKATLVQLKSGAKVLLDASGKVENGKDVIANFTPVFWNTSWFKMRPPHTLGLLIQEDHPIFADFPTSYHSNYQWWEIVNGSQIMQIDSFPPKFRPIVQPIDTWFLNRRLAQLFEAKVGEGKLIVTSLNIDPENGPASAQLKHSIVQYMNSDKFNPKDELKVELLTELFEKKDRKKVELYTKDSPDELQPNRTKSKK